MQQGSRQGWQSDIYLTLPFAGFHVQKLYLITFTAQTQSEKAIGTERLQEFTVQIATPGSQGSAGALPRHVQGPNAASPLKLIGLPNHGAQHK